MQVCMSGSYHNFFIMKSLAIVVLCVLMTLVSSSTAASKAQDDILAAVETDKCTSIVVGKRAGSQGPMNTHTADCADCDFRINKTPARDWPAGSMRTLYEYKGSYPATIASDRGSTWHPDNLEGSPEQLAAWGKESTITGKIPQVPHTFALFEAGYGIMNEYQVAIGESTCAARFWAAPTSAGGKAMIEARELSKIALERTKTAREAVQLMGDLAVKYGFYAADWSGGDMSKGEGGEGLTVIDKEEAWVFHVLSDDTGASAVWAAQRVPDDHVAVIANQFVIRHIDPHSSDFLFSSNMYDVAKRNNLWKESDGPLDFLKTFAPPRSHSPYATRRVWRVFNIVAPNFPLSPYTDPYGSDYPFSVKSERVLTPEDIMAMNRDHYEGTEFDLSKGLAAGPYGDPNRFDMVAVDNLTFVDVLQGSYERAISLFRTSYSFVAVSRSSVPDVLSMLWFSQYAPSSSSYAPFYVSTKELPRAYTKGSLFHYDSSVSFWNFCAAGNYAARLYKFAMQDVFALQKKLQSESNFGVAALETSVQQMFAAGGSAETYDAMIDMISSFTQTEGERIVSAWRDLLPSLITHFHDGYHAQDLDKPKIHMTKLFYPKWWLDLTGYFSNPPNHGPDTIMFASNPFASSSSVSGLVLFVSILLTSVLSLAMGIFVAKRVPDLQSSSSATWKSSSNSFESNDLPMYRPAAVSSSSSKKKAPTVEFFGYPTQKNSYMTIDT